QLQRQAVGIQNALTDDIGQGHFRGRNQVEVPLPLPLGNLEQVFLELGQLPGAQQCLGLNQIGRVDLLVPVLVDVQVEHELGQRAVQPGNRAAHQYEPGAGQLGRRIEVQITVTLTDADVILNLEIHAA